MATAQITSASGTWICSNSFPATSPPEHQASGPFNRPAEATNSPKLEGAVKLELGNFPPSAAPKGLSSHGIS